MNYLEKVSKQDLELLKKIYKDNYDTAIEKLKGGYPIQYLIGNVEFLNTIINVNEAVLIPRFETELLVDKTIKYAKEMFNKEINIIDLGCGSGCIAIALKKNLNAKVTAIDVSGNALNLAIENAKNNNAEVNFLNKDMTDDLEEYYDIIISNPPYIPYDGYVESIVKDNEPHLALFAPNDGLYFYEIILKKHLKNLNKPGFIAWEIGDNQKEKLEEMLNKYSNLRYEVHNDLQGLPRYIFIFNE